MSYDRCTGESILETKWGGKRQASGNSAEEGCAPLTAVRFYARLRAAVAQAAHKYTTLFLWFEPSRVVIHGPLRLSHRKLGLVHLRTHNVRHTEADIRVQAEASRGRH